MYKAVPLGWQPQLHLKVALFILFFTHRSVLFVLGCLAGGESPLPVTPLPHPQAGTHH